MESNRKPKEKSNVMGSKSNITESCKDLVNHSTTSVLEDDWKPGQGTLTGFTSMGLACSNGGEVVGGLDDGPSSRSGEMNREPDTMFTHGTFFGRSSCDEFSPFFSRTSNSVNVDSVPALTQYKKIVHDDNIGIAVPNNDDELDAVTKQTVNTSIMAPVTSSSDSPVQCQVTNITPKAEQYSTESEYSSVQYQTIEYQMRVEPQPPTSVTVSLLSPIDNSRDICEKAADKRTITKSEITSEDIKSGVLEKPVVADTKLFRRENAPWRPYSRIHPNPGCNLSRKDSWSTSDLDKLDVESGAEKRNFSSKYRNRQSSFATGKAGEKNCHKSVHLDLDLYHTVLGQDVDENDVGANVSADQSNSMRHKFDIQGDDTLSARVQLITQKFDSFRRSQLRAISFRYDPSNCDEDTLRRRRHSSSCESSERKEGGTSSPVAGIFENPTTKCLPVDRTVLLPSDVSRIELFFNSQQTQVFSCRCLAELFVHNVNLIGLSTPVAPSNHDVIKNEAYVNTGVPVLVLNVGTNITRRRELVLVLAQQDTGFILWQDKVNYMSEYKELHPGVHTMRVSGSTSKSVHLHMFDRVAAGEFLATFRLITSDPRDELWKMSSKGDGKQPEEDKRWSGSRVKTRKHDKKLQEPLKHATEKKVGVPKSRWKMATTTALSKADISRPCDLQLITRVDPTDEHFRFAFANFLPVTILSHEVSEDKQQDAAVCSVTDDNRQHVVTK